MEIDMGEHNSILYGTHYPNKIFVGCLPPKVTASSLGAYFGCFGEVIEAKVVLDDTKKSKRFGFVSFSRATDARTVLTAGDFFLMGKRIVVGPAVKRVFKEKIPDEPVKILMAQEPVNIVNDVKNNRRLVSEGGDVSESSCNIYHPPSSTTPSLTPPPPVQRYIYRVINKVEEDEEYRSEEDTEDCSQKAGIGDHQVQQVPIYQHMQSVYTLPPPSSRIYLSAQSPPPYCSSPSAGVFTMPVPQPTTSFQYDPYISTQSPQTYCDSPPVGAFTMPAPPYTTSFQGNPYSQVYFYHPQQPQQIETPAIASPIPTK